MWTPITNMAQLQAAAVGQRVRIMPTEEGVILEPSEWLIHQNDHQVDDQNQLELYQLVLAFPFEINNAFTGQRIYNIIPWAKRYHEIIREGNWEIFSN